MKRMNLFFALLVMSVVMLIAIAFVQTRMNRIIRTDKLVDEEFVQEGAPPLVAFTTMALGGFRGLIADFLWLRSIRLQEEGKYFELVQIADWIQKLQPKFAGASAYLGWNMAYNISVACRRQEDRWRWIHRGIETLRYAISISPNDPMLYKELGWIYQHKLGNVMDDAQRYYKYEMAKELLFLYGKHYPDWKALAAAPKTPEEFHALYPENGEVWTLVSDAGFGSLKNLQLEFQLNGELPKKLTEKLRKKDAEVFSNYLRAAWMRKKFLLDPAVIHRINTTYGELDWLIPESQAIYWAVQGIEHSPERKSVDCTRMITQSLQVTFTNGRILFPNPDEASEYFMLIPNTDVSDALRAEYKKAFETFSSISFRAGYENFLIDATVILYSYGRKQEAYKFYKILRDELKYATARKVKFEQFVLVKWEEDVKDAGYKQGNQFVSALIFSACQLLGFGDRDAAAAHLHLAKYAYDHYMAESVTRIDLPPFNEIKKNVTENVLNNYPMLAKRLRAELAAEAGEKEAKKAEQSKQ